MALTRIGKPSNEGKRKKKEVKKLTYIVKMTHNATITLPIFCLKSTYSRGEMKAQNRITGITIRDTVRNIDLTSGPNTSLPLRQNVCNM